MEQDPSSGRTFLTENEPEKGRLSTAGRSDQCNESARRNSQRHVFQHDLIAIFLPDPVDDELAHIRLSSSDQGKTVIRIRSKMKSITTASKVIQAT